MGYFFPNKYTYLKFYTLLGARETIKIEELLPQNSKPPGDRRSRKCGSAGNQGPAGVPVTRIWSRYTRSATAPGSRTSKASVNRAVPLVRGGSQKRSATMFACNIFFVFILYRKSFRMACENGMKNSRMCHNLSSNSCEGSGASPTTKHQQTQESLAA